MFSLDVYMVAIPALPLLAAVVTALAGRALGSNAHLPAVVAVPLCCVLSGLLLADVDYAVRQAGDDTAELSTDDASTAGFEHTFTLWTWANVAEATTTTTTAPEVDTAPLDFDIAVTLRADPLTSVMLVVVTLVSSLVVIYSIGYMQGDPGYWRFFTYVSLFVFSMTMLVSVSNFLLLYVFWEAVGLCSYLLIGFWYQKPEAAAAGKKAFLVNRIGDFGFALGVFLLWTTYGTLNFHDTAGPAGTISGVLGQSRLLGEAGGYVGGGIGLAIALLLLLGACGKSAQFPLHVWLPDAMEGPTPVSALIHAATMVTAGIYMIARCTPLYVAAPTAQTVVACIGAGTALMAGFIALTQNDLKRVLAYSTISQLGYMFLGLGVGTFAGVAAGMFHLVTHAFFKALLFLGAGSVMHATGGVIDMREFSGLRRIMPRTHWTFLIGSLALGGIIPLAGFWSKDAILAAVFTRAEHGETIYSVLFAIGMATSLLTAFYTFRAYFKTFHGPERVPAAAAGHAHESPSTMTIPLVILAVASIIVGWYFEATHSLAEFLAATPSLAVAAAAQGSPAHFVPEVGIIGTLLALVGIGTAAYLFLGKPTEVDFLTRVGEGRLAVRQDVPVGRSLLAGLLFQPIKWAYQLSREKLYLDEIYQALIIYPITRIAALCGQFDRGVIDRLVDGVGGLPWRLGSVLRTLETGMIQFYAVAMALGLVVLAGTLMYWHG
ncbi:MAG: NADH-quinone oxidoreductase subunit L [Pirellulales bacterium]